MAYGTVSISLASVVLDRPDQSGLYIAKDIAGGWAYLITDEDGDARYRGQGSCGGGLNAGLRCALLSALGRVPECRQIHILVETRQAHRAMVKIARTDGHAMAAITNRPVAVMTRPHARASFQVRSAAEHAAATALQQRERAAWQAEAESMTDAAEEDVGMVAVEASAWRKRRYGGPVNAAMAPQAPTPVTAPAASMAAVRSVIVPLLAVLQQGLAAVGALLPRRPKPRSRQVTDWLSEFDSHMATVRADLRDVGA